MTTLNDALTELAQALNVDPSVLIAYAAEDQYGGYHDNKEYSKWQIGSMWEVEGKFLYALVRHLKPRKVVEVGVGQGCSSTHLLAALEANKKGALLSVDINPSAGSGVPDDLLNRWELATADALEYFGGKKVIKADIVVEDGSHGLAFTRDLLPMLLKSNPRVLISHDAMHHLVGEDVRAAWQEVIGVFHTTLIAPSDCGFAWKVYR